jgi:hypothetical protein
VLLTAPSSDYNRVVLVEQALSDCVAWAVRLPATVVRSRFFVVASEDIAKTSSRSGLEENKLLLRKSGRYRCRVVMKVFRKLNPRSR